MIEQEKSYGHYREQVKGRSNSPKYCAAYLRRIFQSLEAWYLVQSFELGTKLGFNRAQDLA